VRKVESKELISREVLAKGCFSAIASKQFGYEAFLAQLIADACLTVMPANPYNFNVDNVRVCKVLGGSITQSEVVKGMVIAHDTAGLVKKVDDAKIVVYTCSLAAADTETKGTVLINTADELKKFNVSEEKQIETMIKSIAEAGVKVIVTGSAIDDMALHFIERYHLMAVKVSSQHDLRRLCRATRSRAMVQMQTPEKESIGFASHVSVRDVGAQKITVFSQEGKDATQVATIVLRSSTGNGLNDVERAVDDGVNVIRMMGRDGRFVAGAGACDIELARQLAAYAASVKGLEQYAINKFATALEVVPRCLAENSGQIPMDVLSSLYAAHEKGLTSVGVNVDEGGGVKDATKDGIIDLLVTKRHAILIAVDAVLTILRVDQIISAKPAGGPKIPQKTGDWDAD